MKKLLPLLLVFSVLLNVFLVYFFVFRGEVIEPKDQRKTIIMSEGNREVVLGEMRNFLKTIQQINEGLLENNVEKIKNAAKSSGMNTGETVPQGLIKSLPYGFKEMGIGTHQLFDEMIKNLDDHFNKKDVQQQLNQILNNCVACHQVYQIKTYKKE